MDETNPALEPHTAPPVHDERPWLIRVRALLEIAMCSSVPTQMLISGALVMFGMTPIAADGSLTLPFLITLSVVDTIVLILLMVTFTRAGGDQPGELWFGRRPVAAEVIRGLVLVPGTMILVLGLLLTLRHLAPWLHNVEVNPLEAFAKGGLAHAGALAAVAIIAGGLREELQRAFVLRRFERHLGGAPLGAVVSSVAFGAGHAMQGWDAAVTTGVLGLFWAALYLRRGSSVAPVVNHAGFNSLEVLWVALGSS